MVFPRFDTPTMITLLHTLCRISAAGSPKTDDIAQRIAHKTGDGILGNRHKTDDVIGL